MRDATPTPQLDSSALLLILLGLPMLMAFAAGVLAALVFAGGPLAEQAAQDVDELQQQLYQVRRSEAHMMTLAAKHIQAAEACEAAAARSAGRAMTAQIEVRP